MVNGRFSHAPSQIFVVVMQVLPHFFVILVGYASKKESVPLVLSSTPLKCCAYVRIVLLKVMVMAVELATVREQLSSSFIHVDPCLY